MTQFEFENAVNVENARKYELIRPLRDRINELRERKRKLRDEVIRLRDEMAKVGDDITAIETQIADIKTAAQMKRDVLHAEWMRSMENQMGGVN